MSHSSPLSNDPPAASNADADSRTRQESLRYTLRSLKPPAQFVSFWAAIGLPFVHVALLSHGLDQRPVALAFVALLAVNVLALYVGHDYNQPEP